MRRTIFAFVAVLVTAASLAACSGGAGEPAPATGLLSAPVDRTQPPAGRPNIVFVLTDDLSMNLVAHMPHVVALQRAGTSFDRYYVVDSLCCPSRASIFTGEYPHDTGVLTNGDGGVEGGLKEFDRRGDGGRSFFPAVQHAGYRTGFFGKYLNGYQPHDAVPAGFDDWAVAGNGYPAYDYTLNVNGGRERHGHAPGDYLTDVLATKATAFVRRSVGGHRPFLLEVAPFVPHAPYVPAPRDAHAADGVTLPRTAAYDTLPSDPPRWLAPRLPLTAAQRANLDEVYRRRIEADLAVDALIARLQDTLRATGQAENTYVVFSSDNGYHLGEYRLLPGKQTAFDTDIHVPLIVTGPGVPAGRTESRLASSIDLAPTFETLTGAHIHGGTDGVSLAGLWHGTAASRWQRAVLVEHHYPRSFRRDPDYQTQANADPPSYAAVRTGDALYVRYANGDQEYYDTRRDPDELANRARSGVPPALTRALSGLVACHTSSTCQSAAALGA